MTKYPLINEYGEINWRYQPKDIVQKLVALGLARYDWYYNAYLSTSLTVKLVREIALFAQQHDLEIAPYDEFDLSIEHPEALVTHYYLKHQDMSHADTYVGRLPKPQPKQLSHYHRAGVVYAVHTHSCFIADPEPADRQIIALSAAHQVEGYPCVLVCRDQERDAWLYRVREYLPGDVQILDAGAVTPETPKKSLWVVDYYNLEHKIGLPPGAPQHRSIIVDHAHFIKNPNTNRTKEVIPITEKVRYRFLVTDFPVNLSPSDLREPLEILGKTQEFQIMTDFLEMVNTDPLDNQELLRSNTEYRTRLAKLYRQLRRTYLVRRADEPGLRTHEHIHQIELKPIPARINLDDVLSDLRLLGLQKTEQAIAWLRRFLSENSGKALIFAHHNDVVEEMATALNLPAIYGKVVDDDKRSAIAASFIHPNGPQALIVASDVELTWPLAPVSALVFVELWITPRQLYGFVDHILGQDETRTLPVHLLHVRDSLDDDALERLGLRLDDYDLTMDGVQPKA